MSYHLFGFRGYEAVGGISDYIDSYDKLDDLKKEALEYRWQFYQVVIQTGGDYINPPKLEQTEDGYGKYDKDSELFYIVWSDDNDD